MSVKKVLISTGKITLSICFWIAIWGVVSFRINNEFLFPSPIIVWNSLVLLTRTSEFWLITITSLLRVTWGILVSLIIGTLLAYLTTVSKLLRLLLSPAISAVKSTPVASFIILALLWLERDILPVFIIALIVVPIVWANVSEGIQSVDKDLLEVAQLYKFSMSKKLFKLYIPTVAPYFIAACKSALGMAWKAGIAAEILATPSNSIGKELYFSKTYLETPTLFAWSLVVIILSLIIEKTFVFIIDRSGKKLHIIPKGGSYAKD